MWGRCHQRLLEQWLRWLVVPVEWEQRPGQLLRGASDGRRGNGGALQEGVNSLVSEHRGKVGRCERAKRAGERGPLRHL